MQIKRRKDLFLIICMVFSIMLAGCSLPGSDDGLIRYNISSNVDNLDPQYVTTANETLLVLNCFEGLMKLNEDGRPVVALAQRYTLSKDKKTYTFHLQENLKWSDGEPLTAKDFVYGFRRIFNSTSPSPRAKDFIGIENGERVLSGEISVSQLGVRALDDRTLEIRLTEPDSFFLELLASPAAVPCREDFFLSCNGRYGLALNALIFNGPFVMTTWKSGRYIGLRVNENYYDQESIPTVDVNLYTVLPAEENAQLLLEDRSDGGPVFYSDLKSLEGYPVESFQSTSHLLIFNPENTVFQDNDIRLGMCTAINRQFFQPTLEENLEITNLLIPSAASILGTSYRSLAPNVQGLVYQRDKAKEHFETGLNRLGLSKLPRSSIICLETGQHRYMAGFLQRQWQKDLNLYINLEPLSETDFYARLRSGNYQLAILPVDLEQPNPGSMIRKVAEYLPVYFQPEPEPETSMLEEGAILPEEGTTPEVEPEHTPQPYSTASEDKQNLEIYLSLASRESPSEAALWYAKAEELLLQKGYIAPLYFENHYFAVSPKVSNINFTPYPGRITFQNSKKR